MENSKNKKTVVQITEGTPEGSTDLTQDPTKNKVNKLKKLLLFGLMGIVFIGCMYLIFTPADNKKEIQNIGLNDAVPEATGAGMQADKQKAYEQELLQNKVTEKQKTLTTLSDYWNTQEKENASTDSTDQDGPPTDRSRSKDDNPTVRSYQSAQAALGSFYQDGNRETTELKKQLEDLKERLAEKPTPKSTTVDDQLALMEKSYQMAAKYLPTGPNTAGNRPQSESAAASNGSLQKEHLVSLASVEKNTVSSLYRSSSDTTSLSESIQYKNQGFYTGGSKGQAAQPKNSIKACVHDTQTVVGETAVRLRLLEAAQTPYRTIAKGTVVTANAKFQSGRLQLKITSVELDGTILPVEISVYDLDGQLGLYVPHSSEMNALSEMAGNMSQQSGTSLMLTQSAGQQVAADLSRGVVQGISGYFAKKVRTPKITLKAGHQVFMVSKK